MPSELGGAGRSLLPSGLCIAVMGSITGLVGLGLGGEGRREEALTGGNVLLC